MSLGGRDQLFVMAFSTAHIVPTSETFTFIALVDRGSVTETVSLSRLLQS